MKKTLPNLRTDEDAERFVATVDLSEYDLSGFVVSPLRFADRNTGIAPNVSLPDALLRQVEARASRQGLTSSDFIVQAIERALRLAA